MNDFFGRHHNLQDRLRLAKDIEYIIIGKFLFLINIEAVNQYLQRFHEYEVVELEVPYPVYHEALHSLTSHQRVIHFLRSGNKK